MSGHRKPLLIVLTYCPVAERVSIVTKKEKLYTTVETKKDNLMKDINTDLPRANFDVLARKYKKLMISKPNPLPDPSYLEDQRQAVSQSFTGPSS